MGTKTKRLVKARKTRSQIAETFVALDNGQLHISAVLESPPDCLGRIRVYDVLRRVPRLSRGGANTVLQHAKVWPLTPMNQLTVEDKRSILRHLPPRVKFLD